jgi:hypothetical protein
MAVTKGGSMPQPFFGFPKIDFPVRAPESIPQPAAQPLLAIIPLAKDGFPVGNRTPFHGG